MHQPNQRPHPQLRKKLQQRKKGRRPSYQRQGGRKNNSFCLKASCFICCVLKGGYYQRKTSLFILFMKLTISNQGSREPRCRHFGVCGGCQFQHIPYDEQLVCKEEFISR